MEDEFSMIFVLRTFSVGGKRHRGQGSQDQGRIREEAERHEQGAPQAAVCSEGTRPPAEEPIAVREAAEEASDGRGGNEEDEGVIGHRLLCLLLILSFPLTSSLFPLCIFEFSVLGRICFQWD